jgi:hypothetical protein
MDQLKLKQIMNLKAKGFYLDNADEMSKLEVREYNQRKQRYKEIHRKHTELLQLMKSSKSLGGDDDTRSVHRELREISQSYYEGHSAERPYKSQRRKRKLGALQSLLQKNAESEFN